MEKMSFDRNEYNIDELSLNQNEYNLAWDNIFLYKTELDCLIIR